MSARRLEYESCQRKLRYTRAMAEAVMALNPERVTRVYLCDFGDHWHTSGHKPTPRSQWSSHRTLRFAKVNGPQDPDLSKQNAPAVPNAHESKLPVDPSDQLSGKQEGK